MFSLPRAASPLRDPQHTSSHDSQNISKSPQIQRRLLDHIGRQVGVGELSGWYNVKKKEIRQRGGSELLAHYNQSIFKTLSAVYPGLFELIRPSSIIIQTMSIFGLLSNQYFLRIPLGVMEVGKR